MRDVEWASSGGGNVSTKWYDWPDDLRQRRFDYVLVDGPDFGGVGTRYVPYSRSGLLKYVPDMLASSFVVVFDDAERLGESDTTAEFGRALVSKGIAYTRFLVFGVKTQEVFCSRNNSFLQSV
jgi:hypothetical protein